MRPSRHLLFLASLFLLVSCSHSNFDPLAEQAKLLRRDAEWAALASAGKDVEKIVSYWSDDAVLIFPGQPMLEGKAAIRAYVSASLKTPGFKIHWVSEKPAFSQTASSPTCAALTSSPFQVRCRSTCHQTHLLLLRVTNVT